MSSSVENKSGNEPLVSVVIPCYNAEQYIGAAITSVLDQTYKNFELIIVNDGSTDGSENAIKKYSGSNERIHYFFQKNQGVSASRNKGIEMAKGEFIAFLDADDVWEPTNLEIKIRTLREDDTIDWVFSDMFVADEKLNRTNTVKGGNDQQILNSLLSRTGDVINAPSNLVVKKNCLGKAGILFDTKLSTSADWDFCIQLAAKKFKGKRIPIPLWTYRVLENSMSRDVLRIEFDNLLVQYKAQEQGLFGSFWFKQKCISNNYLILAGIWWVNGKSKMKGVKYIIRSIAIYPPNITRVFLKLFSLS
jgi:glycosyltransferase involved in cell wall biosynthesis